MLGDREARCYSITTIRAAFWEEFHESGERWFGYFGTPAENTAQTEGSWESFCEALDAHHQARLHAKYTGKPQKSPVGEKG